MKIYTKTGDKGQTSLFDGKRVDKDCLRVESYGAVDELNSFLGLARLHLDNEEEKELILNIQRKLFYLGAELATEAEEKKFYTFSEKDIEEMEQIIDRYLERIDGINKFIIAGSNPACAYLDVARTVCRRVERVMLRLSKEENINPLDIKFINRLSDALYAIGRSKETELIYFNSEK